MISTCLRSCSLISVVSSFFSSFSSSIKYIGFRSALLSKSFIRFSTSQIFAKLVNTNRLIRFWIVAMLPERLLVCCISSTRTSAVRLPKSLDWTKASTMLLASVRRLERLSCATMIRMPQAKYERELLKISILKVRVRAGVHLQQMRLARKWPRKQKLLKTSRDRQTMSIARMLQELPARSLHKYTRCRQTQQMQAAIPQIWFESTSRQILTSSLQGWEVPALFSRKITIEARQQPTPMQQQVKSLRLMEAKLRSQERLQDWVNKMSRLSRGSNVAAKTQLTQPAIGNYQRRTPSCLDQFATAGPD